MTTPNKDQITTTTKHQTGDWVVYDKPVLRQNPWGEITWAIAQGSVLSVVVTYIAINTIFGIQPKWYMLAIPGIGGSLVSLRMNHKKYTVLRRTEHFHPDKGQ